MRCRGMLAICRGFDYLSVMLYKGEGQAHLATHKHRPPHQLASIVTKFKCKAFPIFKMVYAYPREQLKMPNAKDDCQGTSKMTSLPLSGLRKYSLREAFSIKAVKPLSRGNPEMEESKTAEERLWVWEAKGEKWRRTTWVRLPGK
ncbi:hypothetical protein ACLOJK_038919 [Asimina triloba]